MKITTEQLTERNYKLLSAFGPEEVKPFIQQYSRKWTNPIKFYVSAIVLTALAILSCIILGKGHMAELSYLMLGFIFAIFLIPFHELLHLLSYKILGAKRTTLKSNFRKFYFIAIADKFIASRQEFQAIVLAPFAFITIALLFSLTIAHNLWVFSILGTLFIHTLICSGDFALLSFLELNNSHEIVTFTDEEKETVYFFEKRSAR